MHILLRGCAYAATKHGLRGWSLSCYQNLREHNIKVVLINPGEPPQQTIRTMATCTYVRMYDEPEFARA